MIKKTSVLAAIIGVAGLGGVVAQASAAGKKYAVNQRGKMAIVKSNAGSGPPQKGEYQNYAGTLSGSPGGKGRIHFDQVFASQFNGKSVSITGTATFFEPQGSYSGSISGTAGVAGINATVKITKASGLYKGATGKVKVTQTGGTFSKLSFTVIGSIKY